MSKQVKKPAELAIKKVSNINLLPSGLATEPNKKMLDSTLDVMTSKGQMLPFRETYGVRTASNRVEEFFRVETNQVRRESQSNNMLVLRSDDDSYLGKVSYYDIENYFSIKSSQLKDGVVLDKNINVLNLPVDPIKLTDYSSYYWLADDLPPCRFHLNSNKFSIVDDLLGLPFATLKDDLTGRTLELHNGMAVYFTGTIDADYKTDTDIASTNLSQDPVIFYVYGVGNSIGLFPKENLEIRLPSAGFEKRPWDKYGTTVDYTASSWDGATWDWNQPTLNDAEYVVQEKYVNNNNHWQAIDRWHHISTIRTVGKFLNIPIDDFVSSINKALRPIISFDREVKLYNWPTGTIYEINAILAKTRAVWEGKINIADQFGYTLKDGDKVVFNESTVTDRGKIWTASINAIGVASFTASGIIAINNDGAIIVSSGTSEYYQVIYKNSQWQIAQNKTSANQTPLFEFYNSDGNNLESLNDTSFNGGVILGFEAGDIYDPILGKGVSASLIESETGVIQITPNQLNFTTDVDAEFEYVSLTINEVVSITGPYGYKSNNQIIPFYKNRTGLDFTKQVQDLLYTNNQDSSWTAEIAPVTSGFTTIHVYYDDIDQLKFYFDVTGYGLLKFSSKVGSVLNEQMMPLISGGSMKIVCHDLPFPITFKKSNLTSNITRAELITSEYITNNSISNGTIEINLNNEIEVSGSYVNNELAAEDAKLIWEFNGTSNIAYVKPLYKWNFIQSAFTKDQTNPLYNNYDYTISDTILANGDLGYYKQVNEESGIFNRSQDGDKICFASVLENPVSKTAPLSLTTNPLNEQVSSINYFSLYQHATTFKSNSTDIKQFVDPSIGKTTFLVGGGTILKHSDPLSKAAIVATNLPYDFGDLIVKQGKHYDLFLFKLKAELENIINSTDHSLLTSLEVLNLALNRIYVVTPSDELFWSHSNMIGWGALANNYKQANVIIDPSLIFDLENNDYNFEVISHSTGKESILHITYNDKVLVRGYDYWFNSIKNNYTEIQFRSFFNGKTVNIKQWYTTFKSLVPASLAKIGLAPVFMPEIYQDTICRHDGTRYHLANGVDSSNYPNNLVDRYLWEYEKAVWSSISHDVENNNQRELLESQPGYFRNKPQTWNQARQTINNELRQWMLENNIFTMPNDNYDETNGFTLKYQIGTGDYGSVVVGSYKALYKFMFDTDRPHSHPWEMLGYTLKPTWWDSKYSWTDSAKRIALKKALRVGKISNPDEDDIVNPAFARNIDIDNTNPNLLEDFPIDLSGNLLSPSDFVTQLNDGDVLLTFGIFDGVSNWEPGNFGSYEQVFLSTQRGLAAQARAIYLLAPAQYVNLNWLPGQTIKNSWGQKIDKTTGFWQQGSIEHNYHRETVSNELVYTGGIESLYSEFCLLNNKDYASEVNNKFNNLIVNKEFLLNGFTNKDNLRIQSTSIGTQKTILFIPEENYQVRTVKHYPEREVFYSGMKILYDGNNYSLNGFATEYGYFPYFLPKQGSTTSAIEIGNVVIKEKNSYTSTVSYIQYGQIFSNRQEIYDILVGYGKYLESIGLVYEEPEAGDIRNWQLCAKQFIFWSNDTLSSGSFIDVNPCADYIKITGQYGQLENLEGTNENIGQCVDRYNKPLFSKDLLVSRDIDNIIIKTKKSDSAIYGIKLVFVNYESVVHLDSTSIFNDTYFNPSQGTSKRSFITGGKKSINWTGAYYVPGYVFDGNSLIPNLDTMSDLGRNLLDIENTILDTEILDASRAQFGLNRNIELRQLFLDSGNEILFKNAVTYNKGTVKVFDSLNPLTHQDGSTTSAYEEYMIRLGEFGNTKNTEYYEFELLASDIVNDSQIVKFNETAGTDTNIVYITNDSNRWVYKPYNKNINFNQSTVRSELKKSGPVIDGDTDLTVDTLDDLTTIYDEFVDLWSVPAYSATTSYKINEKVRYDGKLYIANVSMSAGSWTSNSSKFTEIKESYLPNIFVNNYNKPNPNLTDSTLTGFDPGTWQVLQTMDNSLSIAEVCTGPTDASRARISTGVVNHYFTVGDYVCIVNADTNTSSANGIWKVVQVEEIIVSGVTKYFFYIDARILETIYTGKVFAFKPVRFKNQAEFNAATPAKGYNWKQKYTTVNAETPSGYDSRYPIAIIDEGQASNEPPVSFNYGNYKVYQLQDDNTIVVKEETTKITVEDIEHLIVYDYATNKTVVKLELFSPQNLVVPEVFKNDIDITGRVDPAKYNRTTDKFKSIYTSLGWYEEFVGRRWWDTSSTQFNDYTTADDQVKAQFWGTTTNKANPEIYEWTKSTVHPSKWAKLVESKSVVFDQVATGEAYIDSSLGLDNYHWVEEEDYVNGNSYTVYYFWVKNKKTIAQESKQARVYTVEQLSKVLLNPSAAGLAWWSPVGTNTMLVKGIKPYLNNSSTVVQIKKKIKGEEKHQQWAFISEGNTVETIPEWLHVRLRDSLSGYLLYKKSIDFTDYSNTAIYDRHDFVRYNNRFYTCLVYNLAAGNFNSLKWYEITAVTKLSEPTTNKPGKLAFDVQKSVPDIAKLHRYNRLGNSVRPYAQTWFNDLYEARRTFIKRLNELMLHIDIIDITNWENSILRNTEYLIGGSKVDMTVFWTVADFRSETYSSTKSVDKIINDISSLYNQTYSVGEYIRINDNTNPRKYSIYEKTESGGFNVVFKKEGTIQFVENFNIYGWDSTIWDSNPVPWDYDIDSLFSGILTAIREEVFIGKYMKYYSSIMCSMFRYVLSEQVNVDWIAKSSTIEPVNLIAQTLSDNDYVKRDEISTIIEFYSSVKAYRDKIRGGTINKVTVENTNIIISETAVTDDITEANNIMLGNAPFIIPLTVSVDFQL